MRGNGSHAAAAHHLEVDGTYKSFFSFGSRLLLEFRVLIDEAAEYILK